MARITVEDCLGNVANRFELVLVAAKRARQLASPRATPYSAPDSSSSFEPEGPSDPATPSPIGRKCSTGRSRPFERKSSAPRSRIPPRASRALLDPLQVNLRRVVRLILLLVIVPTVVLTGIGIGVMFARKDVPQLVLGLLVSSFAASVIAGAVLLLVLMGRGARLARVQETFLSEMGHELMTPLAGIGLHTQILSGMELPADAERSVAAIDHERRRLQELVEPPAAAR